MHYLIDGYNLLFYLFGGDSAAFKYHREKLIKALNEQLKGINLYVTLVFDSQYFPGDESRRHYHHLEIVFTSQGVTADEWIIDYLSKAGSSSSEVIISNDKRLCLQAKHLSAKTQTIDSFIQWLNCRQINRKKRKSREPLIGQHQSIKESTTQQEPPPFKPIPGSVEYYLSKFGGKEVNAKPNVSKSVEKKPLDPIKETAALNEFERWLSIFEERASDVKSKKEKEGK